ncbi:MAG TPA: caspase family protein [Gemmatimonadaceae bacterium]|nr:caspase family protein [Gemmatimonadaceae bacterium]
MSTSARFSVLVLAAVSVVACTTDSGNKKGSVSKAELLSAISVASKAGPTSLVMGTRATGTLEAGDPTLPDSSHYDQWTYDGRAGEKIRVTMESEAFDAYLIVARQNGERVENLAQDDDGAGGTNARISFELPGDGTFLVIANSFGKGAEGAYTLLVERDGAATTTQQRPAAIDYAARYPGGGDAKGRYALLVGIDDYQGIGNSLNGPVADARLIGRILVEKYGFAPANVKYITDREATREHVSEAYLRHLGQAGPEGVAVFYYSGHGMQMEENLALTGALDPEADQVDEALFMWGADGRGGVLLDDELGFLANQLRTDRVLMIMDACFSGTGTMGGSTGQSKEQKWVDVKGNTSVPATFLTSNDKSGAPASGGGGDLLREPQRHLLLAASTDEELSWTASGWPKYGGTVSVFTYYLAEALEAAAPNATFSQVMRGVQQKTLAFTESNYNARQTPRPEGSRSGASIREFLRQR